MLWYTYIHPTLEKHACNAVVPSPPLHTPCTQLWCCHCYPKVFSLWFLSLSLSLSVPTTMGPELICAAVLSCCYLPVRVIPFLQKHSWPWDLGKVAWSESTQSIKNGVGGGGPGLSLPFWLPAFMSGWEARCKKHRELSMHTHAHTHTHMRSPTHTQAHSHTYACMWHMHSPAHSHMHVHTHAHTHPYTCTCTHPHLCMPAHIHAHTNTHACTHPHMHILHTHACTHPHTHMHTPTHFCMLK